MHPRHRIMQRRVITSSVVMHKASNSVAYVLDTIFVTFSLFHNTGVLSTKVKELLVFGSCAWSDQRA